MYPNLLLKYIDVRKASIKLIKYLSVEDCMIQCNPDSSPIKWQLGHTTWFFESFVLLKYYKNYKPFNLALHQIFNSYYESKGKKIHKLKRNILSRPSFETIISYRDYVDKHIQEMLEVENKDIDFLVQLGLQHEQQHQELMYADIKSNLFENPIDCIYHKTDKILSEHSELDFLKVSEGLYDIGVENEDEFYFDNEQKNHKYYINDFKIANRLITNGEYLEFVKEGCYDDALLWHSDGWVFNQENDLCMPFYWVKIDEEYYEYELHGIEKLDLNAPVKHITYYEAWAFAKWFGGRLPTEFEWETAAKKYNNVKNHNLLDYDKMDAYLEPVSRKGDNQFIGGAWEWTESAYLPYPGYKQDKGALGEYNGKFIVNYMILRGGCSYTPISHIRHSYRNFYYPDKRWMLSGIRIVK